MISNLIGIDKRIILVKFSGHFVALFKMAGFKVRVHKIFARHCIFVVPTNKGKCENR